MATAVAVCDGGRRFDIKIFDFCRGGVLPPRYGFVGAKTAPLLRYGFVGAKTAPLQGIIDKYSLP